MISKISQNQLFLKEIDKILFEKKFSKKSKKRNVIKKKCKFTNEEDEELCSLVKEYGENEWSLIAKEMKNRNARQVRDRWKNYLNPKLKIKNWTSEEDMLLMSKYDEIGPRWRRISNLFPNRSTNSIRNRFLKIMNNKKNKFDWYHKSHQNSYLMNDQFYILYNSQLNNEDNKAKDDEPVIKNADVSLNFQNDLKTDGDDSDSFDFLSLIDFQNDEISSYLWET